MGHVTLWYKAWRRYKTLLALFAIRCAALGGGIANLGAKLISPQKHGKESEADRGGAEWEMQ